MYLEILVVILSLLLFWQFYREKNGLPTNWPLLGMLPALLQNIHRLHDSCIEMLPIANLTFIFKGPWLTNMQILMTLDPINIHHILSKNFANYPKGTKFNEMFEALGDGIFNSDFTLWEYHRKMMQSFLGHPKFHQLLVEKTLDKLESGLKPVLEHVSQHAVEVDLQDLFSRFTFDAASMVMMDYDPKTLSIDLPISPPSDALTDVEDAIFQRHVVPPFIWKFLRWLNVGIESKHKKAWKVLDNFIYKYIAIKRQEMSNQVNNNEVSDLLTLYIQEVENDKVPISNEGDKFIRDNVLTNFIAGRDGITITLSWFFYLLSKNPQVASRIKYELDSVRIDWTNFKEVNFKPVYLHAALCETLRLYAPVAFSSKSPIEPDVLPSGHYVTPNMNIIFNLHAMGRMKSLWGDDCNEFKPERWITNEGKIKHEPSYKYSVFNLGPRACPGKQMSFTQVKIVAATIIQNYVIEPVEGQKVVPNMSIFLRMKFGFKVRIFRS